VPLHIKDRAQRSIQELQLRELVKCIPCIFLRFHEKVYREKEQNYFFVKLAILKHKFLFLSYEQKYHPIPNISE
jgi:hypothetical protein